MRTLARGAVAALISLAGTACHHASNVQTFAGPACPAGWVFLYTDHPHDAVVCARDTTAGRPAKP
jgi:hypothetical protein